MPYVIELEKPINSATVEEAYRQAIEHQRGQRLSFAEKGLRLARARHPKLLQALDKAANVIDAQAESQYGQTRRSLHTDFAHRLAPTEVHLWREAYRLADSGEPIYELCWIYGAAAWLAGL